MSAIDFQESQYTPPDVINDNFGVGTPAPSTPAYDTGAGGRQGITDPTYGGTPTPSGTPYDAISAFYRSALGRDPENTGVEDNWWTGTGGNLAAIQAGISGSAEAQAYRARAAAPTTQAPTTGGAFDTTGWVSSQLAAAQSTDDQTYWVDHINSDPNVMNPATRDSALGWWADAIARGDGALAVRNGTLQRRQDGGSSSGGGGTTALQPYVASGPNPGGYTDPSSMLYLNQVMQRLAQVQQPQDNGLMDLLKQLATAQVNKLQQAPYSAADDAALITKYRDPLNTARDTAKQQAALDMSRRGIGPTSGVYQERMAQIDQSYVKGVAQGANQMGVDAVTKKNADAMQSLQILSSLLTAQNTQTDRANALSDQAVNLAKMFPDFDAARLDQLLRAGGDTSGSSAISNLTSLGNLNLNAINSNNATEAANSAAWGKLLAGLIGAM